MRKLLRNMCTMLMASVLLVTGSWGGTTWVRGVENTNTLIEKLTNMEEIQDPEKYTQIYLDENYLGQVPDMWEFRNLKNIEVSEKNTKLLMVHYFLKMVQNYMHFHHKKNVKYMQFLKQ